MAHLGDDESAAVLRGYADAHLFTGAPEEFVKDIEETRALFIEHLGASRVAELEARGAALDSADAVAFMRAAADRALDE